MDICCTKMKTFIAKPKLIAKSDVVLQRLCKSLTQGNKPNFSCCIWCNQELTHKLIDLFVTILSNELKINFNDLHKSATYCCKDMENLIANKRTSVIYEPIDRRFILEGDLGIEMNYCPWCGNKLPKNLREEWFETLSREYGIKTDIGKARDRVDIPEEFWSDQWWKKRKL